MSALKQLRVVAFLEGISFVLLLFVAMPLKHFAGVAIGTRIMGSLHGLLFLAFVASLFRASSEHAWAARRWLGALGWSLLPFGMIFFERALRRELACAARAGQARG